MTDTSDAGAVTDGLVPALEPMPVDAPTTDDLRTPIDRSLASFANTANSDGSGCLYLRGIWKIRSALDAMQTFPTPLMITTSSICWKGFETYEERALFRPRKAERRKLRAIGVGDVQGAEIAKDAWWPQSPSYLLLLHWVSGSVGFHVQHPEAVSCLREVVEALKRVGIATHDRHDIFWAGGGDPHYRPPFR